jgi:hypothetical protein
VEDRSRPETLAPSLISRIHELALNFFAKIAVLDRTDHFLLATSWRPPSLMRLCDIWRRESQVSLSTVDKAAAAFYRPVHLLSHPAP